MIIDCHGHYTTAPAPHLDFRTAQLAWLEERTGPPPVAPAISDDVLRSSVEHNQLRVMRERGTDLTIFSPQASAMGHDVDDPAIATAWARASNDLVARVVDLFPEHFAGVGQLPQTPNGDMSPVVAELRRCVEELGFVGCNLNCDPSGGYWISKPLTDPYWFPLYEALVELEVPAMVHVSASCNPNFHTLGAHYLNADTTVFMQLLEGDLFATFPTLRLVIPHGGGAVPYHWGRYEGLAVRLGRPPLAEHLMGNVSFDSCVYHLPGAELLHRVVPPHNVLFASEMLGAVRGEDPATGVAWDHTKYYLDRVQMPDEHRQLLYEGNARSVYPRLDARLRAQGR